MRTFDKSGEPDSLRFEAAGLRWLAQAEADGGAPVVQIHGEGQGVLELAHLPTAEPQSHAWGQFYAEYQIRPYMTRALGNHSGRPGTSRAS